MLRICETSGLFTSSVFPKFANHRYRTRYTFDPGLSGVQTTIATTGVIHVMEMAFQGFADTVELYAFQFTGDFGRLGDPGFSKRLKYLDWGLTQAERKLPPMPELRGLQIRFHILLDSEQELLDFSFYRSLQALRLDGPQQNPTPIHPKMFTGTSNSLKYLYLSSLDMRDWIGDVFEGNLQGLISLYVGHCGDALMNYQSGAPLNLPVLEYVGVICGSYSLKVPSSTKVVSASSSTSDSEELESMTSTIKSDFMATFPWPLSSMMLGWPWG
jgi:hypothetical protein